jgi:NAD(P)H dehydrogenase (quinone)
MIEHKRPPILVTGAGGEVGSVSRTVVRMLLEQQYPVRAFVRRDDERAEALRRAGAQVFVGDLLNVADVAAALNGCRRVCFSMSLNSYYSDATILMAAAARAQGDIEVFVNISEFEQTFMTFDRMTAAREARLAWLGGSVSEWSPQQRAHWSSEQALLWSGLPVVNIRATMFAENPILCWFPLRQLLSAGELHLPFGSQKIAPIVAHDVAEICAKILIDPADAHSDVICADGPGVEGHGWICGGLRRRAGTQDCVCAPGAGCLDRDLYQQCSGISQPTHSGSPENHYPPDRRRTL